MTAPGFTLFDTAIGRCGIAWSGRGIAAVQLPARRTADTRQRLAGRVPGATEAVPPAAVARDIDAIAALLDGQANDLSDIVLDTSDVAPFACRVYEATRTIPPGATASYGEVADWAGSPGAARAVGQALGRNPFAIVVPCHRVLGAGGKVGGFSADGGIRTKLRMLAIEGVTTDGASREGPAPLNRASGRPRPSPHRPRSGSGQR